MIFCDECSNFPHPDSKRWGDCTKKIYLCDKGIRMNFYLPSSPVDDEWGFQKERCDQFSRKELKPEPIVYGIRGIVAKRKTK